MQKNVASQQWIVFAFDLTDNTPLTGDAANITGNLRLDGGAANAIDDTNPTELEDGYYVFDITQAESNGDMILISPESSTGGIQVIGVPGVVYTTPVISSFGLASDLIAVSGDDTAADNLELQYDGTGLTGDTFPATQLQLSQITSVGAAINTAAESYTLTTGTQSSGTFADTAALDSVYHQHTDTAGVLELYYEFDVGGDGVPTSVTVTGRINGSNDSLDGLYAYNWGGTSYDRIGDFIGQTSTVDVVRSYDLFTSHVGTGVNLGKVRIRFYAAAGLTTAELFIDQIFTSYAVVARTVGYANGAVWIDTINGSSGIVSYINGTADNPVLTLAEAITIAGNLNLSRFEIIGGSTITFGESHDSEQWSGTNWTLVLGTQSVSGSAIIGATISGICTGAVRPKFSNCTLGTVTLPPCRINGGSGFTGTLTLGSAGNFDIINCTSLVAGAATPTFDLGAAVGATNMSIRDWSGGLTFNNIIAGDVISLEGLGGNVNINGTGGSIFIRGIFQDVVDNTSNAVTITETATLNREALSGYVGGSVWIDTINGSSGIRPYVNGTIVNPVDNIADAYTLLTATGLHQIECAPQTALVLPSDSSFISFGGESYTIDLNGQNIEGAFFNNCFTITGIGTGGALIFPPSFILCVFGSVTLPPCNGIDCALSGTFTLSSEGDYSFAKIGSAFGVTPIIDFGSALNASEFYVLDWTGGALEIQNAGAGTGSYKFEISGMCDLTINSNCSDTTNIVLRGHVDLTNNSAITSIIEEVNYSSANVNAEVVDVLTVDTFAEPSGVPAATSTLEDKLSWLFTLSRNKGTQTSTTKTLRNDADSGDIATATVSDAAGTFTRGEFS
ncbi:hypothetical protein KAR91_26895 [Candidatus Pacearchaeota archaeon]|nr:hypothetical protein [Candidatus Pacearchaeota archaeon]